MGKQEHVCSVNMDLVSIINNYCCKYYTHKSSFCSLLSNHLCLSLSGFLILFVPPCSPYSEPVDLPSVDKLDPEFGLHGYTLHFVLHNTSTEIMSGHFRQLSCHTGKCLCDVMIN